MVIVAPPRRRYQPDSKFICYQLLFKTHLFVYVKMSDFTIAVV